MSWTWKPPHLWQRVWGTAMRQNILLQVFKEKTPCYPVCGFDKATCLPYIFLKFEKDLLFSELVVSDLYNCRSSRFSPSCPAAPAARLWLCPAGSREKRSPANPSAPNSAFLLPPSGHGELWEHGLVQRGMSPTGRTWRTTGRNFPRFRFAVLGPWTCINRHSYNEAPKLHYTWKCAWKPYGPAQCWGDGRAKAVDRERGFHFSSIRQDWKQETTGQQEKESTHLWSEAAMAIWQLKTDPNCDRSGSRAQVHLAIKPTGSDAEQIQL